MEKPTNPISAALPPNPSPSSPPSATSTSSNQQQQQQQQQQKRRLPTAEELVAHYESQGLDSKEASLKVIEDLQTFLHRAVASSASGRGKKERFMTDAVRKLDNLNTRLAILDMKLDSKPGYSGMFAIGVSAGAAVKGIGHVLPHVMGAIGQMWDAVRSSTDAVKRS